MQSMAREAGFDLKIRVTEFATALKLSEQGDFETFFIAWSGRTDPDGNVFVFDTCSGPINISKFCDKEVDRLLGEARQVNDPAKRKALYKQVADKVIVGGPILYLYHRMMFFAHTVKLQGFKPMPDGLIRVVGLKL
jgi:peptide/nickel transport system substrate-binding protein